MSSQAFSLLSSLPSSSFSSTRPRLFLGVWYELQGQRISFNLRPRCTDLSITYTNEYVHGEMAVINPPEDDTEEQVPKVTNSICVKFNNKEKKSYIYDYEYNLILKLLIKVAISKEIMRSVERIKKMLKSMEDGEINISAYDTAWVRLVKDVNGSGEPQFPSALQWISNNQLPDGSWGDALVFNAHDRILSTLACVVTLKSWNLHPHKVAKGLKFFKENLSKLEEENEEHMSIGFEVVFPSLLELARKLDIDVPDDSHVLQQICECRNTKLKKIPKDIMHKMPTSLLHSLEGMPDLEWEKLLKLQFDNGSFLFSPSSTAYAFMQTQDDKCLIYLNRIVQRFNGGVPNVYPVDLFEHTWAADRLQRLGISRLFEQELKECMNYVARYWREDGMCWARNSNVRDVDDSSMGFRMLRLYGHNVSADVFKKFKKDDTWVCMPGQSTQAITGMYNLFRASQVLFPGEMILEEAREFCYDFLREKQSANAVVDKWIISKDLPGEVAYALDVPWFASLPTVEARFYIEQYGGDDDVWIGKVLYRMPFVNNNEYLELAKFDYNSCQALHRAEWDNFQKWYDECNLGDFGVSKRELLLAYYISAASIFEPEKSKERLAWAKTSILLQTIDAYFHTNNSIEERKDFVHQFNMELLLPHLEWNRQENGREDKAGTCRNYTWNLKRCPLDALVAHGTDISHSLRHAWEIGLTNWEKDGDKHRGKAELIVKTINLTTGPWVSEELLNCNSKYEKLFQLSNYLYHQLGHFNKNKVDDKKKYTTPEIESSMQELAQLVLQNSSDGLDSNIKQTFFTVVKSIYYTTVCDLGTTNYHMSKVLFERVY
uniref:Copalyl diphosphate n=1 Tax=Croton sublyratus TaxID=107238 RepID=Q9MAX2_9ROSI|nr:copalyl diphosphate [Croton sublyratus]